MGARQRLAARPQAGRDGIVRRRFPEHETMRYLWPWPVAEMNDAMRPFIDSPHWWNDYIEEARQLGGTIHHKTTERVAQYDGGYGNYLMTVCGPVRWHREVQGYKHAGVRRTQGGAYGVGWGAGGGAGREGRGGSRFALLASLTLSTLLALLTRSTLSTLLTLSILSAPLTLPKLPSLLT